MTPNLPNTVTQWTNQLTYLPFDWGEMRWRVPFFRVYAQLTSPIPDSFTYYRGKEIAIFQLGRYQIPLINPFDDSNVHSPAYALILSYHKSNKFGLFAYPADRLYDCVSYPV